MRFNFKLVFFAVVLFNFTTAFSFNNLQKKDSAYHYFKLSKKFSSKNKSDKAYLYINKAKSLYLKKRLFDSVALCNIELFDIISGQKKINKNRLQYLLENEKYKIVDTVILIAQVNRYAQHYFNQEKLNVSSKYYRRSILLCKLINKNDYAANTYRNLGLLYTKKYPDSAKYFFEKSLKNISEGNNKSLVSTYINYSNLYSYQEKPKKAIKLLEKARLINLNDFSLKFKKNIFKKLKNNYSKIGDFEAAFNYQEKYIIYNDSVNEENQNIAIAQLDEKRKVIEREKEIVKKDKKIIETEAKRIKNRNFLIGALLFILLSGTIGLLSLKNSKRKRKLAEQEKEIETQKNLTLLKEQELTTINAMVNGQEKERKRIAEDLHDNLGSVLATLKLHFENLQINSEKKKLNQDVLFSKTGNLIDEAYLKVRSIAHAKNAGVIANQGLLIAVKMMAEKISSADKINIEVIDFGLDKRLENSLEISIFRIIQELITNIIKHADASNAAINLALYDHNLNIIVEDNGKGFDVLKVNFKNGMGINSIKTRIEHIGGNLEIDSTLKKGTSIIINIPVE